MKYTTQVIVNTNRAYKRYTVIVRQTAKGVVLERSGDSLRSLLNEVTDWTRPKICPLNDPNYRSK